MWCIIDSVFFYKLTYKIEWAQMSERERERERDMYFIIFSVNLGK